MRTGIPEYEAEPDGLDLDAMFRRLEYRVRARVPGPGSDAAIRAARRRRAARTGVAVVVALAIGVVGAKVLDGRAGAGEPGGPVAGTSSPPGSQTPGTFVGGSPGDLAGALLPVADVPFAPLGGYSRLDVVPAKSWAQECGLRAPVPTTDAEIAVVFLAEGVDLRIDQYIRLHESAAAAQTWQDAAQPAWQAVCAGDVAHGTVTRVTELGTVDYVATVWLAQTPPQLGDGVRIELFAAGRSGAAVTSIRLGIPVADAVDSSAEGFVEMVTTAMELLAILE